MRSHDRDVEANVRPVIGLRFPEPPDARGRRHLVEYPFVVLKIIIDARPLVPDLIIELVLVIGERFEFDPDDLPVEREFAEFQSRRRLRHKHRGVENLSVRAYEKPLVYLCYRSQLICDLRVGPPHVFYALPDLVSYHNVRFIIRALERRPGVFPMKGQGVPGGEHLLRLIELYDIQHIEPDVYGRRPVGGGGRIELLVLLGGGARNGDQEEIYDEEYADSAQNACRRT